MPAHKFILGQKVRYKPDIGQWANGGGETFTVVRLLPETDGILHYQVQSEMDGHARVVRESQLVDL